MTEKLNNTTFRPRYSGELKLTDHMRQQSWNPGRHHKYFLETGGNVDFEQNDVGIEIKYDHDLSGLIKKLLEGFWQILPLRWPD